MTGKGYPPAKDRRDIGQVLFPIEELLRARDLSSCCVGTEAILEQGGTRQAPPRRPRRPAVRDGAAGKD